MTISGMDEFQSVCRENLIRWYRENKSERVPAWSETYIVWSVKALGNYKCLASTSLPDTIYAEYTFNGDKGDLYEDVYEKLTNTVIKDK